MPGTALRVSYTALVTSYDTVRKRGLELGAFLLSTKQSPRIEAVTNTVIACLTPGYNGGNITEAAKAANVKDLYYYQALFKCEADGGITYAEPCLFDCEDGGGGGENDFCTL